MWKRLPAARRQQIRFISSRPLRRHNEQFAPKPLIAIENGTFYHHYPTHETVLSQRSSGNIHAELQAWRRRVYRWSQKAIAADDPSPQAQDDLDSTLESLTGSSPNILHRQLPPLSIDPANPPLFPNLDFRLDANRTCAVVSTSSRARTTFLSLLAGAYVCLPAIARTYPGLLEQGKTAAQAVRYVGFDAERGGEVGGGGSRTRGAYLSARYEARQEEGDWGLRDYLLGRTELNGIESEPEQGVGVGGEREMQEVVRLLNLEHLLELPVANLSNGQMRRARIGRVLMERPEVLLLDGPFMGLDPASAKRMNQVLAELQKEAGWPRVMLSLRPEDGLPSWVDDLVVVDAEMRMLGEGPKHGQGGLLRRWQKWFATDSTLAVAGVKTFMKNNKPLFSRDGVQTSSPALTGGQPLVQMQGVKVTYGQQTVLGDWEGTVDGEQREGLWWTLRRGHRAGIFGANGSGKTTMLSLITSDHPQTYGLPIRLFGCTRLPEVGQPGISIFDIQRRMGHSSPEVHAFFPRNLTVRRVLESAWADAPMARPDLTPEAHAKIAACLRWFERELAPSSNTRTLHEQLQEIYATAPSPDSPYTHSSARELYTSTTTRADHLAWADDTRFAELSFTDQRLVLFLRAVVARPDLVILDEALSGVDEATRDRALLFLSHGERVSRVDSEGLHESAVARMGQVCVEGLGEEQALLVVSHAKEDVPGCVRQWIRLPEPGSREQPREGELKGPLELDAKGWNDIWGRGD